MIAALIIIRHQEGRCSIARLLRRGSTPAEPERSLVRAHPLLIPLVLLLTSLVLIAIGRPMPDPEITLISALAHLLGFFITTCTEEVGWMGYTTDPMLKHWSALVTVLTIGVVWSSWHVYGRYVVLGQHCRGPLASHRLGHVACHHRRLNAGTGNSVLAAPTPCSNSHFPLPQQLVPYDPVIGAAIAVPVAAVVVYVRDARTLDDNRFRK